MLVRKQFYFGVTFLLFNLILTPAHAIYNGSTPTEAPIVVQIIMEHSKDIRQGVCSGAVISSNVVVTAAHCVTDKETGLVSKKMWVSPPGAKWKKNADGFIILENTSSREESRARYEKHRVTSVELTSNFYSDGKIVTDNDVAFLVVEGDLQLTTPITLASDEETENFISTKKTVKIYGYGVTNFDDLDPLGPQSTSMSFSIKHPTIANTVFVSSSSTSACSGDSGGPVIVSTPNRLYLVGIISGGFVADSGPACNKLIEGVYLTSITLLTKYANLAFQSAILAAKQSQIKLEATAKESQNQAAESETLFKQATRSIETLTTKITSLNAKIAQLNSEAIALQKKLIKICKSNKKVKGC